MKIVSIQFHHSIKIIERYHDSLHRVYIIIVFEILDIDSNSISQMTFKVFNDSTDFNNLIFILLVFDTYFRIIKMNVSFSTITQQLIAIRKTIKEVRKTIAFRQIHDVLNIRNDSNMILIHDLSLNSFVLMYRERNADQSKSWKDSYKLLNIENESTMINISSESTKLRATSVKSYYENDTDSCSIKSLLTFNECSQSFIEFTRSYIESQSDDVSMNQKSAKCDRDRSLKYFASSAYLSFVFNNDSINSNLALVLALVVKFERNHTSLSQFAAFRQNKTIKLLEKDVFQSINRIDVLSNIRILNFRVVDEIKHFNIDKTFEKSRFVVQTFKNIQRSE